MGVPIPSLANEVPAISSPDSRSLHDGSEGLQPLENHVSFEGQAFEGNSTDSRSPRPWCWEVTGHDLLSLHADQHERYHQVMTTTAVPAACLDLKDQYRGPMDTVIEEIPEAVMYEFYPEEKEDEARRQEFELTWADDAFCEHSEQTFDELYYLLPSSEEPPTFLDLAESFVTEPQVTFVTDAEGKTVPMTTALVMVRDIQGKGSSKILRALLDSGGSSCMASVKVLPPGTTVTPEPMEMVNTLAGHMTTEGSVTMTGLRLPEFDRNIVINEQKFKTFNGPCKYDIIFGADFLKKLGIKLDYANLEVEFAGIRIPMNTDGFTQARLTAFVDNYHLQI